MLRQQTPQSWETLLVEHIYLVVVTVEELNGSALSIKNERNSVFAFIFGCFVYFLFCFSLASGIKPITGFMKSIRNIFSWSNPAASFLIFVVS